MYIPNSATDDVQCGGGVNSYVCRIRHTGLVHQSPGAAMAQCWGLPNGPSLTHIMEGNTVEEVVIVIFTVIPAFRISMLREGIAVR